MSFKPMRHVVRWNADNTYLVGFTPGGLYRWGPRDKAKTFSGATVQDKLNRGLWTLADITIENVLPP